MADQILRRAEVEQVIRLSRTTIYDLMNRGAFPRPVRLSARAVGWRASDVQAWIESRAAEAGGSN